MHERWKELCEILRDTLFRDGWKERMTTDRGQEQSGFVVVPRGDGGCGIYYVEPFHVPFLTLVTKTQHYLTGYQQTFAREGVEVTVMEPTTENGQAWLLYSPPKPADARKLLASALL